MRAKIQARPTNRISFLTERRLFEHQHELQRRAFRRPCSVRSAAASRSIRPPRADDERRCCGGRGEIRTHETLAGLPVFKTGALNHSATLPRSAFQYTEFVGKSSTKPAPA